MKVLDFGIAAMLRTDVTKLTVEIAEALAVIRLDLDGSAS